MWAVSVQNTWILFMILPVRSKSLTSGGHTDSPVPELRTFAGFILYQLTYYLSVVRLIETCRGLAGY
jgi:hypothetical protein